MVQYFFENALKQNLLLEIHNAYNHIKGSEDLDLDMDNSGGKSGDGRAHRVDKW